MYIYLHIYIYTFFVGGGVLICPSPFWRQPNPGDSGQKNTGEEWRLHLVVLLGSALLGDLPAQHHLIPGVTGISGYS